MTSEHCSLGRNLAPHSGQCREDRDCLEAHLRHLKGVHCTDISYGLGPREVLALGSIDAGGMSGSSPVGPVMKKGRTDTAGGHPDRHTWERLPDDETRQVMLC